MKYKVMEVARTFAIDPKPKNIGWNIDMLAIQPCQILKALLCESNQSNPPKPKANWATFPPDSRSHHHQLVLQRKLGEAAATKPPAKDEKYTLGPPQVTKGNPEHHTYAAPCIENNDPVTITIPGISQCMWCSETLIPQTELPLSSKYSVKSNNPLLVFNRLHLKLFRTLLPQFYLENHYRPSLLDG